MISIKEYCEMHERYLNQSVGIRAQIDSLVSKLSKNQIEYRDVAVFLESAFEIEDGKGEVKVESELDTISRLLTKRPPPKKRVVEEEEEVWHED